MVRSEDSLVVDDQVEDNIAFDEQVVSAGNNDSDVPEQVFDLNEVVPNEAQWTDPAPVTVIFEMTTETQSTSIFVMKSF